VGLVGVLLATSYSTSIHNLCSKKINYLWTRNKVNGSCFALSENGWIDQELFFYFLTKHFINNAVLYRSILMNIVLISSPKHIEFAKDHGIILFCLPPHTTHICQQLDCSLFKLLVAMESRVSQFLPEKSWYGNFQV